jgi:hypothetical protein
MVIRDFDWHSRVLIESIHSWTTVLPFSELHLTMVVILCTVLIKVRYSSVVPDLVAASATVYSWITRVPQTEI